MDEPPTIRINDPAFAKRLANLLVETRRRRDLSLDDIVRLAGDRLSRSQLKDLEAGTLALTEPIVETVASVYGADLAAILSERLPIAIEPPLIVTGGITREFDPAEPNSLLTEYLKLVRGLRHQQKAPVVDLRRSDIETLAGYLHEPDERVLDRLLVLMGATRPRRLSMAVLLASGVAVIGLVGGAAALAAGGDGDGGDSGNTTATTAVVASAVDSTILAVALPGPTTTLVATTTTAPTATTLAPTAAAVVTTTSVGAVVGPTGAKPTAPRPTVTTAPTPTTTVIEVGQPPLPTTTPAPVPETAPPGEPLPTVTSPPATVVEVGPPPLPPEATTP